MGPKKIRSNQAQLRMLVEYMLMNKAFANAEYSGPYGFRCHIKEWELLRDLLNEHGSTKTVQQWRLTWRDLKKKARDERARLMQVNASTDILPMPTISDMNRKILRVLGKDVDFGDPMDWSNEKIINFLNEIHVRPELWDVESGAYRDRDAKKESWSAVAAQFDINADEAYKKFRNLRTYAKTEHNKKKKSAGGRVTWFAYEAISFLLTRDDLGCTQMPMGNAEQMEVLIDFLERHPELAEGRFKRTTEGRGRSEARRLWAECASLLNGVPGVTKEPEAWRVVLSLQLDPKEQDAQDESSGTHYPPTTSSKFTLEPHHDPKPKKKNIVFATVKQACVDLVKKHGHPITLIDDEAFRSLIQLMPMTMKEKSRITSEYIQKFVDATGEEEEAEMSYQDDRDASDNDDETAERIITIKGEIEEVPCNCNARVSEENVKSHEIGCPAAAKQPYWNYFEVTTDEATCQICNLTLSWTNITKLKEHLTEKHPTAEYVDDGEEFTRGPASDVWSHEDTEEVYLEDDFDTDPLPTPSARKRKRTSERFKSRDERPAKEKTREERIREMREEREGLSQASRRVIELAPDRFKSLDSFGAYVAELMKLIPKEKCLKYQVQIVQRLLQEQAAAG